MNFDVSQTHLNGVFLLGASGNGPREYLTLVIWPYSIWLVQILIGSIAILGFQKIYSAKPLDNLLPPLRKSRLFILPLLILLLFLRLTNPAPEVEAFAKIYYHPYFLLARIVFDLTAWFLLLGGLTRGKKSMGPLAIIFILITGTQFAYDWIMILTPHWASTGFGLIFLLGALLSAFSFSYLKMQKPDVGLNDLGKIHFALIGAWTYLNLMQYIVIWSGNLSSEASWYLERTQSSWKYLSGAIILFQCVFPLGLLLVQMFRSSVKIGRLLALNTLLMQSFFTFLLVAPGMGLKSFAPIELSSFSVLIILSIWLGGRYYV